MNESAQRLLPVLLFAAFSALAALSTPIFSTPASAQSPDSIPDGSTPTPSPTPSPSSTLLFPKPEALLFEPPSISFPRGSKTISETRETEASSAPQGGPAGFADKVFSRDRLAPRREDRTAINIGGKHVSAVFNGFEQGAGIGFGVEFTTANSIRQVELRATMLTSTRFYRRFEVAAFIPKIGDEKTHAEIWFSYMRRTKDPFFGLGPRSNRSDRTNFDAEFRDVEGVLFREFAKGLQAGVFLGRQSIANYRGQLEDQPPIDVLFSGNPQTTPVSRYIPGLGETIKLFGYGAFAEYDRRNNNSGLTRGGYFYGRLGSYDGLDDGLSGDYGWIEAQIDGRVYIPIGGDKTSLALRAMTNLQSPKRGSQIAFYANSFLGGRSFVRGYDNFRFRSHNLLLYAGELRRTVLTLKEDRGADVILFGDVGRSWGDTRSKTDPTIIRNDLYGEAPWRAAYGFALQFRYSKSVGIRIDWAHSPERNHFYFSVSRGF